MWGAVVFDLAVLGISYAYHRHEAKALKNKNADPRPASEILLPRTDDGASVPLLFGRCRVRSPWLAWTGNQSADANDPDGDNLGHGAPFVYRLDMFFIVGIPFRNGLCRVWNVWVDDAKLGGTLSVGIVSSGDEEPVDNSLWPDGQGFIGQFGTWYDGNSSQLFCQETVPFAGITEAGIKMAAAEGSGATVPSFRGYLTAFLYAHSGGWWIGNSPSPGSYSFEGSSFPSDSLLEINSVGDDDVNPADVVFDLLVATFGKLGLPVAYLDLPSFEAAATTLLFEGHGYSRSAEDGQTAADLINEICEQVDGVVRPNPTTKKVEFKLIRPDFDPDDLIELTPSNGVKLSNYEAGNWEQVINKLRIKYNSRALHYQDDSVPAQNQANATDQIGSPDELLLSYPGVTTEALASLIAEREISFRSRPLAKCQARCSREFDDLMPGDPVKVTWPEYVLSGRVFRITKKDRGTLANGAITLHLMQDVFFVHRGEVVGGTLPPLPGTDPSSG